MSDVSASPELAKSPSTKDWLALAVLSTGLGLIVLDGTIVGVALPAIIEDLSLNHTDAQWVNRLYAVVLAALLLSTGKLVDRWAARKCFSLVSPSLLVEASLLLWLELPRP